MMLAWKNVPNRLTMGYHSFPKITQHMLSPRFSFLILLLMAPSLGSCQDFSGKISAARPISHQTWDTLLKQHVRPDGRVNYPGFIADSTQLNDYLQELSANFPTATHWSREERLAYWINAYNAFTVQLVIRHYPVESIKDIGPRLSIPFLNSVWDIKFIEIEGERLDLNNIEHSILRKEFDEPRIHFAINCASVSCPVLRPEAYIAEKLEQQLEEQAVAFINDPVRNQITRERAEVSKIFSWFKGDFTKNGSLRDFLNRYAQSPLSPEADIDHLDYNWSLND
jgi:hypothetical protein